MSEYKVLPGCLRGEDLHLVAAHQDALYRHYIQRKMRIPAGLERHCINSRKQVENQLNRIQGETFNRTRPENFCWLFTPLLACLDASPWEAIQSDGAFLMAESELVVIQKDLQALADGIRSYQCIEDDLEDFGAVSKSRWRGNPCTDNIFLFDRF